MQVDSDCGLLARNDIDVQRGASQMSQAFIALLALDTRQTKCMNNHFMHVFVDSTDITNTARSAGIPYRTFATAALMDRYAGEEQMTDGEPLSLWDIIWKTRLALACVEPCVHEINDQFEVYWVELFSLVKGKPSPELVQVHAILDLKAEGSARLLLKLQDEA